MATNQYEQFDNALLAENGAGRSTIMQLDTEVSGLRALAEPHCRKGLFGDRVPPWRIIDRRLQALGKRGLIRFNVRAWVGVA